MVTKMTQDYGLWKRGTRLVEDPLSVPDACVEQVLFEDYKLKALSDLRIKMQTTL
jgi:hypothetical protein